METDRELLKLAAKAAWMLPPPEGIDLGEPGPMSKGGLVFSGNGECLDWNPLTDDGDALRLAVKLQLQITPGTYNKDEFTAFRAGHAEAYERWSTQQDECAATRRAIVRAAAEIGRSTHG